MKSGLLTYALALAAGPVVALPSLPSLRSLELSLSANKRATDGFNAADQKVSTTGAHAWVAPGTGDHRGPCPGYASVAFFTQVLH
jgi:hypothetical protein